MRASSTLIGIGLPGARAIRIGSCAGADGKRWGSASAIHPNRLIPSPRTRAAHRHPRRRTAAGPRRHLAPRRLRGAAPRARLHSGQILIPVSHVEPVGWIADTGRQNTPSGKRGHDVPAVAGGSLRRMGRRSISSATHADPKLLAEKKNRIGGGGWKHPFTELVPQASSSSGAAANRSVKT